MNRTHTHPVDYVLEVFDRFDIVVLAERWHPELTQYDFILSLAADPRFSTRVGVIFTEVGTSSLRPFAKALLESPGITEQELDRRILRIYRSFGPQVVWLGRNLSYFVKGLYRINEKLPKERKIEWLPSDLPFDWDEMTTAKYQQITRIKRDPMIADQVAEGFRRIQLSASRRKKVLVIMNYRHAFQPMAFDDGDRGDNVTRYLFEAFPGRIANILLNTVAPLPGADDDTARATLVQSGKWDAAFQVTGNRPVGLDFAGTPLGADEFDLFPYTIRKHKARYSDVFTGFVFFRPLSEHRMVVGVPPGFLAEDFAREYVRRMEIAHGKKITSDELSQYRSQVETPQEFGYQDMKPEEWPMGKPAEQIERWLR